MGRGGDPKLRWGVRLRRLREAAGLTQAELAGRASVSAKGIAALETGRRLHPHPSTVRALASALDLSEEGQRALAAAAIGDAPARAADTQAARPVGDRLPSSPTGLIGRERDIAVVAGLFREGERLVTLTGPGGVGKTRLALAVAFAVGAAFPDGTVFVSLAAVDDHALVVPALARALNLTEIGGQSLPEQLRSYLRDRRILLVLDNLEQVLDAAPELAELRASCPGLAMLATSRAPLRVRGEREYPLPPLPVPAPGRVPDLGQVAVSPAVRLFAERVRAVAPGFALTRSNIAAVAAICRRLDGMPLALELAAVRARALSLADLLARLDRALPLLTGGARDLPERQRTMRGTIGWSYRLLREPERMLLNRLSAFRGGWDVAAAEAVGAGSDFLEGEVLDLLSSLVEQSLVLADAGGAGPTRHRMLVPVREYAEERLIQGGEAEEVRLRHAAYFLALAESAAAEFHGARQRAWLERLDRENDNLRAALSRALERRDAGMAARLAGALRPFWEVRGHFSEGNRWVEAALAAGAGMDLPVRIGLLNGAGTMAYWQGEYDRAALHFEESLSLSRRIDDKHATVAALNLLGGTLLEGDVERAVAILEEGVALGRALGNRRAEHMALLSLGTGLLERGDTARARQLFEEALSIGRATGDKLIIHRALFTLAMVSLHEGAYAGLRGLLEEGIATSRDLGNTMGIAYCLDAAASAAAASGAGRRAARLWGAADALREGMRSPRTAHQHRLCARYIEGARAQIGEASWARALAEGRALTLEQAVAYALTDAEAAA